MTRNGTWLGYMAIIGAIIAIAVLAVSVSAEIAAVTAGAGLLLLAGLRLGGEWTVFTARSRRFDVAFLAVLGAGITILALLADNI